MRARLVIAAAAAIALGVTGCSTASGAAPPPPAAAGEAAGDFNDADVKFSQEMIPHHQQTIQLADIASRRTGNEQVKVVAASVLANEAKEIKQMTGWLTSWGKPAPSAGSHGGHSMPGMLSTQDMAALEATAPGPEFDQKWLKLVVQHLRNGVEMCKQVQRGGKHAETRTLAMHIIEAQEQQIEEVQALVK